MFETFYMNHFLFINIYILLNIIIFITAQVTIRNS